MPTPARSTPVEKRKTLRDEAYSALKNGILDGTFLPGERLDDTELQEWLGISRTPIREAIMLLGSEGLVDTKAQRYTRVATADPRQARDELLAVGALMSGVLRQAVVALTPAGERALLTRVEAVAAAARDRESNATFQAILQLHEATLRRCPNAPLVAVVSDALTLYSFHLQETVTEETFQWEELALSCVALRAAVRERDGVAAELVMAAMHFVPAQKGDA